MTKNMRSVSIVAYMMTCLFNDLTIKDLLQLIVDATTDDENVQNDGLTDDEIVNIVMDILLTGYDTTANTLAFVSYQLALNPDVQEKLQQEIGSYFEENPVRFASILL